MKIHHEEMKKPGFDDIPMSEVQKMVGWIEPPEEEGDTWDVNTADGGIFTCSTQEIAHIMSGVEELKAKLFA